MLNVKTIEKPPQKETIQLSVEKFPLFCRICLDRTKLLPIFDLTIDDYPASELIASCFQLSVDEKDNRPANVCSTCIRHLSHWNSIKKRAEECELLYRLLLNEPEKPEVLVEKQLKAHLEEQLEEKLKTQPEDQQDEQCGQTAFTIPDLGAVEVSWDAQAIEVLPVNEPNTIKPVQHPFTKCEGCDKRMRATPGNIERHRRLHAGLPAPNPRHQCNTCGRCFTSAANVRRHAMIHTGERPHVCPICGKGFIQFTVLETHVRTHTNERPFLCDACGAIFRAQADLNAHARRAHGTAGSKQFTCAVCGKAHRLRSQLAVHERTHTGERPFKCEVCGKGFTTRLSRNAHRVIHAAVKPHQCRFCTKRFAQVHHRQTHENVHTGAKPHVCAFCGKGWASRWNLKAHESIHTGNYPIRCEQCQKGFHRRRDLEQHQSKCQFLFLNEFAFLEEVLV